MNRYLREATGGDVDLLFRWANDTLVRKNSFSTKEIKYEEHIAWYQRLLNASDSRQYIYMEDDLPVGQARVKVQGNEAEIGYSICSEKRAMGYGKELLRAVREQVWKDFPEVMTITGQVKPENIASQKAFMGAGYEQKCYVYETRRQQENNISERS